MRGARNLKKVVIYTDGACSGNPGPGGWGAVLIYGEHRKEIGGGEKSTTNNRMELTAAIKALEALKEKCEVELYSDSAYMIDAHNKGWLDKWERCNYMRKTKGVLTQIPNTDLWMQLRQLEGLHCVSWQKVRGHAGVGENEVCDKIATSFAAKFSN